MTAGDTPWVRPLASIHNRGRSGSKWAWAQRTRSRATNSGRASGQVGVGQDVDRAARGPGAERWVVWAIMALTLPARSTATAGSMPWRAAAAAMVGLAGRPWTRPTCLAEQSVASPSSQGSVEVANEGLEGGQREALIAELSL